MNILNFIFLLPELYLLNFLLIFLWYALYLRYKTKNLYNYAQQPYYYSIFLLVCTLFIFKNTAFVNWNLLSIVLISNSYVLFLKMFMVACMISVLLISIRVEYYVTQLVNNDVEINILRLIILVSMLFLLSINDFVYLFFILELYSLSTYILIGFKSRLSVISSEAALKYFLLGTIFSIIMAYGIALIYMSTGLTNFLALNLYLDLNLNTSLFFNNCDVYTLGLVLLTVGFLFKLSAAPFHVWAPDVYDGTSSTIMFFLFIIPKIAIFGLLINLSFLWEANVIWFVFGVSAVLSFVVGALMGLFQKRIKRLLTYSMINNNGFFLLALLSNSVYSFSILLLFLIIYTVTLIGLFGSIISLRLRSSRKLLKTLWGWTGLFFNNRVYSIVTTLFLFSSAGLPPLVGFLIKFLILLIVFLGYTNFYYFVVVSLLLASLSCFYYIRIIKVMAFNKKNYWLYLSPISYWNSYFISLSCIGLILLFLGSGLLINFFILILL